RDPPGVRAQAAVGLPPRRHRDARDHGAELPRLAAPPVRQRHQRRPAPLLHALDGAHLPADGVHLRLRARHALGGPHPADGPDAVRARVDLQLPRRRALRRLPVRRPERRDDARQLLLDGPLPLHDHGRADLLVLRRRLLLGAEDDRLRDRRAPREDPLLDDVRRVQLDVRAAARDRVPRHAAPCRHVRRLPAGGQRLGLRLGVRARGVDAPLHRQPRLVAGVRARARSREPLGLEVDRVPAALAGAGARLRPDPDVRLRPLSVRRRRERRRAGAAPYHHPCEADAVTELAHHSTDYAVVEREPPEVMARNLRTAAQLWSSATAFFFFAFLFAYFYLRSLNQSHLWKPKGVDAPVAGGTIVAALVVASALVAWAGARRLAAGDERAWRGA